MANSKLISFSNDFKKQYPNREKPERDEIDNTLKDIDELVKHILKKELSFKKIKMPLRIKNTSGTLEVLVLSTPCIIVKRIT